MTPMDATTSPTIIAHRGAPLDYPENSLAGYKAMLNMAMIYPQVKMLMEVDIRMSRDKVCVGLHDAEINRTFHGRGHAHQHAWDAIRALPIKRKSRHVPIDFAALAAEEGSDAPLLPIDDAPGHPHNDFRAPCLEELLTLTAQANRSITKNGTPVGLCIDLKAANTFPALADTLNHFFAAHPDAQLPLFFLGITSQVKKADMDTLYTLLDPAVRTQCYDQEVTQFVRNANLQFDRFSQGFGRVTSAATAALGNAATNWHFIGDPDPSPRFSHSGEQGRQLRGNYPSLNSSQQVEVALPLQDAVWVNCGPEAMRVMAGKLRGADFSTPLPRQSAKSASMGLGE